MTGFGDGDPLRQRFTDLPLVRYHSSRDDCFSQAIERTESHRHRSLAHGDDVDTTFDVQLTFTDSQSATIALERSPYGPTRVNLVERSLEKFQDRFPGTLPCFIRVRKHRSSVRGAQVAQFVQCEAQVRWQRRRETYFLSIREVEPELARMQELSIKRVDSRLTATIDCIANDWVADKCQVHPDLMSTARFDSHLEEGCVPEALHDSEMGDRRPSSADDRHSLSVFSIAANRGVDGGLVFFHQTGNERQVRLRN
jgi:hypothetical protein